MIPSGGAERTDLRFSPALFRWFVRYLRFYFARSFTAVRVSSGVVPQEGPLLLYSNHPSWWDPILAMLLVAVHLPGREGFGPMDAGALARYGMFRRLGAFPVERGTTRGARAFLRGSLEALRRGGILFVTAEGDFRDPRTRPVRLAPGVGHLAARASGATALPVAFEYPFWDERRPEALARFGDPFQIGPEIDTDPRAWGCRLAQELQTTMDRLAEDARSREAGRFRTLLEGRVGVGGIYDRWRWLRAALRGDAFDAAHGTGPR